MKKRILLLLLLVMTMALSLTSCDTIIDTIEKKIPFISEMLGDIKEESPENEENQDEIKEHEHRFGKWELTTNASDCTGDIYSRYCSTCDEVETKQGAHKYNDELTYDETHHWHECSFCDQVKDKSEHRFSEWELTTYADNCEDDVYSRHCSNCDKIETKNGEHTYNAELTYDETHHWHECSGCNQAKNKEEHQFINNVCTSCEIIKPTITFNNFSKDTQVTITFYHTMGYNLRVILDKYIEEFNKLYPNITIEHFQVGSYDDVRDQIRTELTVGRHPNIAYCYPEHVAYYNNINSTVIPLDQFISSSVTIERADGSSEIIGLTDKQKADFISAFLNEGAMYMAQTILDALGFDWNRRV